MVTGTRAAQNRTWFVGAGAALALSLIAGWRFVHARRPQVAPSASVIAVLPFLPSSPDTALARLGRDLVLTVSANLDGVGGIRTADPRLVLAGAGGSSDGRSTADAIAFGKNLGAGSVVVGDIVRVGPDVRLDLKLLATSGDSQPLARATIASAPDSIGVLTDSVTWALLRQVWRRAIRPRPAMPASPRAPSHRCAPSSKASNSWSQGAGPKRLKHTPRPSRPTPASGLPAGATMRHRDGRTT